MSATHLWTTLSAHRRAAPCGCCRRFVGIHVHPPPVAHCARVGLAKHFSEIHGTPGRQQLSWLPPRLVRFLEAGWAMGTPSLLNFAPTRSIPLSGSCRPLSSSCRRAARSPWRALSSTTSPASWAHSRHGGAPKTLLLRCPSAPRSRVQRRCPLRKPCLTPLPRGPAAFPAY